MGRTIYIVLVIALAFVSYGLCKPQENACPADDPVNPDPTTTVKPETTTTEKPETTTTEKPETTTTEKPETTTTEKPETTTTEKPETTTTEKPETTTTEKPETTTTEKPETTTTEKPETTTTEKPETTTTEKPETTTTEKPDTTTTEKPETTTTEKPESTTTKKPDTTTTVKPDEPVTSNGNDDPLTPEEKGFIDRTVSRITFDMNQMLQLIDELSDIKLGVVSSPVSVVLPLTVLLLFSHGYSRRELRNFLLADSMAVIPSAPQMSHLRKAASNENVVKIVQIMLYQENLKLTENFQTVMGLLGVKSAEVDFENADKAAEEINDIIRQDSNDTIKDIVDPKSIKPKTDIMFVNSLYVKGEWKCKFEDNTEDKPFNRDDGHVDMVPTMFQVDFMEVARSDELQSTILVMPFADASYTFLLINPDDNNQIKNISMTLQENPQLLDDVLETRKSYIVEITMPKFKMESRILMRKTMEQLGVTNIFDPRVSNLQHIYEDEHEAYISSMLQEVIVEIDEQGVEVSSVNSDQQENRNASRGFGAKPFQRVDVDKPFLFIIRHNDTDLVIGSYQGLVERNPNMIH